MNQKPKGVSMAHVLIMPRQGNTVESCIITGWKVKEGDAVTPETVVCEVETDKAAFEIPAGVSGTVLKQLHASGDDIPVLQPIAVIGAAGEPWQEALQGSGGQRAENREQETERKENAPDNKPAVPQILAAGSPISPRARNLAEKEALPLEALSGSGPGGRIIERDVTAALQDRPRLTLAAKAAKPGTIPEAGSGIGGRINAADLTSGPAFRAPLPTGEGAITEIPVKGIRKIISDRMHNSLTESAQFTLNASASAVKLMEIRGNIKKAGTFAEEHGVSKITVNDLVLFAVSRMLPRFPFMNAHKAGDTIKVFERVHLAVAVDTPRGLMVPVIRNANLLSLGQISRQAKHLAESCQNGSANPAELSGSTFTVTSLGSLGITSFTPILNTPEVAILGVCGIEMKPVLQSTDVHSASNPPYPVVFEPHIGFSLTINHQAVDGAPAARFLKALTDAVANIDLLLAVG